MPCRGHMHLVVDEEHRTKLPVWLDTTAPDVHIHILKLPDKLAHFPGYIGQQWANMWADKYVLQTESRPDYLLFIDSDSVLAAPITCQSLFDENGKMYMPGWDVRIQHQFINSTVALVGVADVSYMAFFPLFFPMASLPRMRSFIAQHNYNDSREELMDDAILAFSQRPEVQEDFYQNFERAFSQFVIMGNYLVHEESEQVRPIFCPSFGGHQGSECQNWSPQGAHYGWRYCLFLGSCAAEENDYAKYFNMGEPNFSTKFSSSALVLVQEMIMQGICYRDYLIAKAKYGQDAKIPEGCTLEQATTLHHAMLPYPTDPSSPEREKRWAELFTPHSSSELCHSYAVMQRQKRRRRLR